MTHIALVGPMHSGKTTLATMLVERGYTRIGLADEVKGVAMELLNSFIDVYLDIFPDRQDRDGHRVYPIYIDRREIADNKTVFRPFLQWFGTDFARQYLGNSDCWIEMFAEKVKRTDGPIVCDDVRFPNEAEALRALGFRIIRLYRPEEDRLASVGAAQSAHLGHASECGIAAIDVDEDITCATLADLEHYADLFSRKEQPHVV